MDKVIRYDCFHFAGHKPCTVGYVCDNCDYYKQVKKRILIVLLRRLGDILICSPLTERLKKEYPQCHISWLVNEDGKRLVELNPNVDRCVVYDWESIGFLSEEKFDLVISFERTYGAAAIVEKINANKKVGLSYGGSYSGLYPVNDEAEIFFYMNLYPEYRNNVNKLSWIDIYFKCLGFTYKGESYCLSKNLLIDTRLQKPAFESYILLNIGASKEFKRWPIISWIKLVKSLTNEGESSVLITGGKDEMSDLIALKELFADNDCVYISVQNKTIDNFLLDISSCKILVTADTFAMHVGIAFSKTTLALFGPSKGSEVVLPVHDTVTVLKASLPCCPCGHIKSCSPEEGECMPSISVDLVYSNVLKLLTD